MSPSPKKTIANIEFHYAEAENASAPASIIKESFYRFVKHQLAAHTELNNTNQVNEH